MSPLGNPRPSGQGGSQGYEIERSYQAQPGCLSGCAVVILRVHRLAWRHRAALKPFGLALGVLVVTVAVRTASGYRLAWQPFVLLGGTALGAAAGLWWFGHRVRLDRTIERGYAAAVAVACGIWAEAAYYHGPLYPPMLWALLAGTVAGGVPWWWHRRIRRRTWSGIQRWKADLEQHESGSTVGRLPRRGAVGLRPQARPGARPLGAGLRAGRHHPRPGGRPVGGGGAGAGGPRPGDGPPQAPHLADEPGHARAGRARRRAQAACGQQAGHRGDRDADLPGPGHGGQPDRHHAVPDRAGAGVVADRPAVRRQGVPAGQHPRRGQRDPRPRVGVGRLEGARDPQGQAGHAVPGRSRGRQPAAGAGLPPSVSTSGEAVGAAESLS